MDRKPVLAIGLCLTMLLAGCLSATENVEVPDVVLPDDWSTITARSVASPQLHAYDDCDDLEQMLKASIEEEYRIQLLQAVSNPYFYGAGIAEGNDVALADGAVAEGSDSAQTRTTAPTRVEGEDFSGTNNQEAGVD